MAAMLEGKRRAVEIVAVGVRPATNGLAVIAIEKLPATVRNSGVPELLASPSDTQSI